MPGIPLRNPLVENDTRGKTSFTSGLHRERLTGRNFRVLRGKRICVICGYFFVFFVPFRGIFLIFCGKMQGKAKKLRNLAPEFT
jgi:hypothetical protein